MEDNVNTSGSDTGATADADLVNHLVRKLASGQVREIAEAFLNTVPGSWTYGNMIPFGALLKRCVRGQLKPKESEGLVFRAIVFRYHYLQLADEIVIQFQLPQADSQIAMLWNRMEWRAATFKRKPATKKMHTGYMQQLETAGFRLNPAQAQFEREFNLPIQYLAACFVEAHLETDDVDKRMNGIANYLKEYDQMAQQEILESEVVNISKES